MYVEAVKHWCAFEYATRDPREFFFHRLNIPEPRVRALAAVTTKQSMRQLIRLIIQTPGRKY